MLAYLNSNQAGLNGEIRPITKNSLEDYLREDECTLNGVRTKVQISRVIINDENKKIARAEDGSLENLEQEWEKELIVGDLIMIIYDKITEGKRDRHYLNLLLVSQEEVNLLLNSNNMTAGREELRYKYQKRKVGLDIEFKKSLNLLEIAEMLICFKQLGIYLLEAKALDMYTVGMIINTHYSNPAYELYKFLDIEKYDIKNILNQ